MNKTHGRYYLSNFLISLFVALFLLSSVFFSYAYFSLNLLEVFFLIFVSVVLYALTLIVLLFTSSSYGPIKKRILSNSLEPKRSENEIINAIVKEVYNSSEEIPVKVGFVANSKTKIYHKIDCKLADKVDAKYRLENNSEEFFKRRKFKKCKTCFKK